MKIFITGGLGFVGRHLSKRLLSDGHEVTAMGRTRSPKMILHNNFKYISGNSTKKGVWQEELNQHDAVINLAGATIFKRWTKNYKKIIYESRILTTQNIVEALDKKTNFFCSASAVGYYGARGENEIAEDEAPGNDFLAHVGRDWEAAAFAAEKKGLRVAIARFGVILGKDGGAFEKMSLAFRMFAGGPLGSGEQWFSWMHIDDLCGAIVYLLENEKLSGAFNFCAPQTVKNREMAKRLGKALNRPAFMPAPAFMVKLALGEFGSALLTGQRAIPKKLLESGFHFKYQDLERAFADLFSR